jgi:peptide deformylase
MAQSIDSEALDVEVEAETETDGRERITMDSDTRARRDAALANVRRFGDPVLRAKALVVERFDDTLAVEIERMGRLMVDALGIGLAATQVGVLHRLLVYSVQADSAPVALINPRLQWAGKEKETMEEGCLSLPGVHIDVERPVYVRVQAQDPHGAEVVVEASGLEARVIQHEMDHLDGVLILDRVSRDVRKQAMRAMREAEASSSAA